MRNYFRLKKIVKNYEQKFEQYKAEKNEIAKEVYLLDLFDLATAYDSLIERKPVNRKVLFHSLKWRPNCFLSPYEPIYNRRPKWDFATPGLGEKIHKVRKLHYQKRLERFDKLNRKRWEKVTGSPVYPEWMEKIDPIERHGIVTCYSYPLDLWRYID